MASSRANAPPTPSRASSPMVTCDLCEAPMQLPDVCRRSGQILGLLVCSQCAEDSLDARQLENNHAPY